jgi:hypothetical protein
LIDVLNSTDQEHVFGAFFSIPPAPQQPFPTSYEELYVNLTVTLTKIDEVLREWNSLASISAAGFKIDTDTARRRADKLPSPLRPLVCFLLTRRYVWERAKSSAPQIIEVIARIALHARTALQLDAAIAQFWDTEARDVTVGDQERDALGKSHTRLFKGAVELCWIYKELIEFERLSTHWSNRLPPTWLEDDDLLLANGRALFATVTPLVDWANAARQMDESLRRQRRTMWRPINRPFEARHNSPLWYWFGNPRPDEMPQGFDGK